MSVLSTAKWLNCFQYCSKALKVLGHVMVLMVLALVLVSYYAVVGHTFGPLLFERSKLRAVGALLVCLVYTVMVAMLLWCYFAAVVTDPGRVPAGWHPFLDEQQARHELERLQYAEPSAFDRRDPRRPRWCKRCQGWKPERTHHCSTMGRCVLKMDHYCIWICNCVGLMNYKFFLLFLLYVLLASLTAVLMLIQPLIDFFSNRLRGPGAPFVFLAFVMDCAFAISVAGFLIMHLQLLSANCTTIEMYEKDRMHPWPYNKGLRRNLEEVFGRNKWKWVLPLHGKDEKRLMLDSCLNARLLPTTFLSSTAV